MRAPSRKGSFLLAVLLSSLASCGGPASDDSTEGKEARAASINLYSGREEKLVAPILSLFEEKTGIEVNVKYGKTAELAATLLEEGERSPADMFLAQDAGALGALEKEGLFEKLPGEIIDTVPPQFRSPASEWVGVTGRVRTVVYNTDKLSEADIPPSILDFTDPKWKDRIGWAPSNGSFQAFVTALRKLKGDGAAREWLLAIKENNAKTFAANIPIVQAVSAGEVDVGFVNHYYAIQLKKEDQGLKAVNYFFRNEDPGGLVNVSGAGILKSADNKEVTLKLIEYFLSAEGQRFWTGEEFEYPLLPSVAPAQGLPPLGDLKPPPIKLSDLDDLQGTLKMLGEVGLT